MNSHRGAIKNIASQTLPNHPCKFGTFVQKITLCPYFCAKGAYYYLYICVQYLETKFNKETYMDGHNFNIHTVSAITQCNAFIDICRFSLISTQHRNLSQKICLTCCTLHNSATIQDNFMGSKPL